MSQIRPIMPLMSKILIFIAIFLQFLGIFVASNPLRHSSTQFVPFRQIRQSQSQPILGKLATPIVENLRQFEENLSPPHCSRATVTLAHSSKLTKRSAQNPDNPNSSAQPNNFPSSTQLSLNIGIGQTVCFTATGKSTASADESRERRQSNEELEQKDDEVLTLPKSNFSFIVALAKQPKSGRTVAEGRTISSKKGKIPKELEGEFPSNQVLHSISVLDLEQFHAITERYRFAIPELETRCICECESGTANCAAALYKYGRCGEEEEEEMEDTKTEEENNSASEEGRPFKLPTKTLANSLQRPTVCHRTFFANQPTGRHCSKRDQLSSTARLCCQLRFRPYQGRTFTALRLENAVSSVLLQYSQWGWREVEGEREAIENETTAKMSGRKQHWMELERRKVRIQLDGAVHNTVLSESAGLKLSVMGLSGAKSSAAQLETGIYFAENQPDGTLGELIGQMPVNRIIEHDFHKLGWFRLDERGQPFVQSGEVFLDKLHHARVDDCAEQRFRSVLDASYYVNADNNASTQFKMTDPLHFVHKWIRSAQVLDSNQRIALVRAREGLSLEVTLMTGSNGGHQQNSESNDFEERRRVITFVHNSSRLTDFTAMLVIDRFSNSMLNLMLFNASGVLNGYVRPLNDLDGEEEIDGFSVNVPSNVGPNQSATNMNALPISIQVRIRPYPLGSIHVVCLRPDDAESIQELCRPVQSVYHELEVNTVRNEWNEAIGACKKCNQITAEGFAKYLNPANWTKGINSFSEALMLISDIICYFIAILILYAFLVKVLFPLIGCCCTVGCLPTPASIFCKTSNKK